MNRLEKLILIIGGMFLICLICLLSPKNATAQEIVYNDCVANCLSSGVYGTPSLLQFCQNYCSTNDDSIIVGGYYGEYYGGYYGRGHNRGNHYGNYNRHSGSRGSVRGGNRSAGRSSGHRG